MEQPIDLNDEAFIQELAKIAQGEEEKINAHAFLNKVAQAKDTTKLGNLREEEVGIPTLSVRTLKELELYSRDVADEDGWGEYFKKRAEILTATSLAKDAKLIDLAVLQRREIGTGSGSRKESTPAQKKNWFGRKK